jgi:hypothetical protein
MDPNTPAEAPVARKAAAASRKTISNLPTWPPRMAWSFGHAMAIEPADTIVEIEWVMPADGLIGLRLAKEDGQEYGVELSLPPAAVAGALEAIRPGAKLSAVGGLGLAELSSGDDGKVVDAAVGSEGA